MTHELHTLTGAYAVDALSAEEAREFEAHLASCESCAEEVRGLRATAARMGGAEHLDPPARLRESVMAEVRRTRQVAPVADLSARIAARRRLVNLAAAAAVLAIVAGGLGSLTWREHQAAVEARAATASVTRVLAAPDAQTLRAGAAGGAGGTVVMSESRDSAVFIAHSLPPLAEGRTYQLWVINDEGPRPEPVLRDGADGATLPVVATRLEGAVSMAVTVEPEGGSKKPTSEPVLVVPMA